MRATGIILCVAAACLLIGISFRGCDRSMYYETKHSNTVSTTTPGATVSLSTHAELAQEAMRDVESMSLRALSAAGLMLVGTLLVLIDGGHRLRNDRA